MIGSSRKRREATTEKQLQAELSTYRHAFETTATDRDRWKAIAEQALIETASPVKSLPADSDLLPPIDLATQHVLARRLSMRQTADHYFFIDVVGTCNLRCPSCAVGNMPAPPVKGLMSARKFEDVLTKIRADYGEHQRVFLDLYNWGEPGLHPKLSELVKLAKNAGFGVGISSNLNVFPDLRDVIKAEPDYIRVSLSGLRQATYETTHKGGSVFALLSNLYRLRDLLNLYASQTIVQMGFHVYRTNFPTDFLAARSLCDELGFLFSPVLATLMPAERTVAMAEGRPSDHFDEDLLEKLVLSVDETLAIFRAHGPPTEDCQFRQARTTINFDASVSLCCATYERNSVISSDFLTTSRDQIEARKYDHGFCADCMGSHVNKLYTGFNAAEKQDAAISVLGPLYAAYLDQTKLMGSAKHVVVGESFESKQAVYERGLSALSHGEPGWNEAETCFDALVTGAPDFAEGFFQAAALARRRGQKATARALAQRANELDPNQPNYRRLKDDLDGVSE